MNTAQKTLFLIPETPLLFSAVGCIWRSFHEDNQDDFEFNQDINFENDFRSPGWLRYKKKLK